MNRNDACTLLGWLSRYWPYPEIPENFRAYVNGSANSRWPLRVNSSDSVILMGDWPLTFDVNAEHRCLDYVAWHVKAPLTVRLDEGYFLERLQAHTIGQSRPVAQLTAQSVVEASGLRKRLVTKVENWIAVQDFDTLITLGKAAPAPPHERNALALRTLFDWVKKECEKSNLLVVDLCYPTVQFIPLSDPELAELAGLATLYADGKQQHKVLDFFKLVRSQRKKFEKSAAPNCTSQSPPDPVQLSALPCSPTAKHLHSGSGDGGDP